MKKKNVFVAFGVLAAFIAACWAFPKVYFGKIRKYYKADMSAYF